MRKLSPTTLLLLLLLLLALGSTVYFYRQVKDLKKNPQVVAQEESKELVEKVSKLMYLPEGEDPTIATVSDVEKLKEQPFFVKAENGYKVLIYTKDKKAILFNPVNNKIVEVAPLNIGDPVTKPAAKPKTDFSVK